MKKIIYILISGCIAFSFQSCKDLDLEPKGILDESALFGNEAGARKYLAGIYNYAPIEDFNYHVGEGFRKGNYWDAAKGYQMSVTGEAVGWPWGIEKPEGFDYWPYDRIREINTMIEGLPQYKSHYTEGAYNALYGEVHFLRAFYYFSLAKRYGGIPLIDKVQDPTADPSELNVPRGTESETYKFIHNDLKIAIENMPAKTERGRANKYVAAALMSRAMLYAGTIAKYGGYTTSSPDPAAKEGYVGIPSSEAEWFFTESYNASVLFESAGYSLYEKNPDKEQNYADLFLDVDNTEDIWIKEYDLTAPDGTRLRHSYDGCMSPSGDFSSWPGSQAYPTLETVELYQSLPIENADGTPRRFNEREDMLKELEPRLLANVYFSGMELRGVKFDIRRGFYKTYDGTMEDAQLGSTNAPINSSDNRIIGTGRWLEYEGKRICGGHGSWNGDIENNTISGFFVRKYVDYRISKEQAAGYGSAQAWKIFRYAEILLNRAEAAYELGNKEDAFEQIAKIRNRAGATPYDPASSPGAVYVINGQTVDANLQFIRDERRRELLFENHRWWDIRRWRVADKEMNQLRPTGLMTYKVLSEDKYIFIREYCIEHKQFNFEVRNYYESIPQGELNKNPNLVQNPIY